MQGKEGPRQFYRPIYIGKDRLTTGEQESDKGFTVQSFKLTINNGKI